MTQDISIFDTLTEGWEYHKRHRWLTVGAVLIWYAILIIGTLIPYFKYPFTYLFMPAFAPGLYFYLLNVARDSSPQLTDLFAGFRRYGTWFALALIYWLALFVFLVPTFLRYGFSAVIGIILQTNQPDSFSLGITVWYCLSMMILWIATYRFWLVFFIIMDEPEVSVIEALRRSSRITKGNGHNVILFNLAGICIIVVLMVALLVPALIFGPFVGVAFARMYLKLKTMHDEPIAQTDNPAIVQ